MDSFMELNLELILVPIIQPTARWFAACCFSKAHTGTDSLVFQMLNFLGKNMTIGLHILYACVSPLIAILCKNLHTILSFN